MAFSPTRRSKNKNDLGKDLLIKIEPNTTVENLKRKIQEKINIPISNQIIEDDLFRSAFFLSHFFHEPYNNNQTKLELKNGSTFRLKIINQNKMIVRGISNIVKAGISISDFCANLEKEEKQQSIDITIKTLSGKNINININPNETVQQLITKIKNKETNLASQIRIVHNGKQIQKNKTIDFYNIKQGAILYLVENPTNEEKQQKKLELLRAKKSSKTSLEDEMRNLLNNSKANYLSKLKEALDKIKLEIKNREQNLPNIFFEKLENYKKSLLILIKDKLSGKTLLSTEKESWKQEHELLQQNFINIKNNYQESLN